MRKSKDSRHPYGAGECWGIDCWCPWSYENARRNVEVLALEPSDADQGEQP